MILANKVAVITGSTAGIGKAIAETYARNGAKVLISGRDKDRGEETAESIRNSGGAAFFTHADLLDQASPGLLVEEAVKQWGRIDIIVNNAAMGCHKSINAIVHEDWDRLYAVNVKAAFFLVQEALPWLVESKGNIINISSINGIKNESDNLVYDTMKACLNHMTTGLAMDLGKYGIRCNALMPGATATALLDQYFRQTVTDPTEANRLIDEARKDPATANVQQIAEGALFLASDQSMWINAAKIPIDGGYHLGT